MQDDNTPVWFKLTMLVMAALPSFMILVMYAVKP
jgi:hypothetical protein